mmetsp:Transcript_45116/g.116690  ORF Transcript_45116/g.116690 Transcript_45116/m.116690 type:complete len:238 (+) Transcript_45116:630-1343(+)
MLEVIVGKTLEQAMMEVLEEEELASLRAHQEEYEFIRQAELAEAQRMEEAERRKFEEKERRVAQEKKRVEEEEQVSEKVAARAFARHYVSDVLHGVFDNLQGEGYFYDPLVMEVKSDFMPWLRSAFEKKWSKMEIARKIADALIEGAVQRGAAQGTEEDEKRIQRENEEKARQARLARERAENEGTVDGAAEEAVRACARVEAAALEAASVDIASKVVEPAKEVENGEAAGEEGSME